MQLLTLVQSRLTRGTQEGHLQNRMRSAHQAAQQEIFTGLPKKVSASEVANFPMSAVLASIEMHACQT